MSISLLQVEGAAQLIQSLNIPRPRYPGLAANKGVTIFVLGGMVGKITQSLPDDLQDPMIEQSYRVAEWIVDMTESQFDQLWKKGIRPSAN